MTSRYRHRRTPNPGTAFPSPIEPGEIAVNTANRQLAVGDADNGSPGVPLTLIGVRVFDARASYAVGDFVVQAGSLYRAKSAVNPGAFNAAAWDLLSTDVLIKAYADAGDAAVSAAFAAADTTITTNYQAADAALTTSVNGKVAKAGDTMTGPLVLPVTAPTLDPQAANKKYVDDKIAAIPTPSSLTVSDTPPVGVPDGALWWESDSGLLYVRYNDGNTTQWVIACPQPDINAFALANTVVRYDTAQSLTAPQQQQARQNIYAAPFDAMAYGGLQINSAMEVNQERFGSGTSVANSYICDGWKITFSGTMVPFGISTPSTIPGFPYLLSVTIGTAQATLNTTDHVQVYQLIEGWRIGRLAWGTANAQPITLCFWSAHHRTGLYGGVLTNVSARSYAFTYTQAAADVPQYNVITIPGCTDGTWATDNTAGMVIHFPMGCGPTYIAPSANTWLAGNYVAAPGQINGVAATSDVFRLTGVTVLPGNEAPSAARSPLITRQCPEELRTCLRYYENGIYFMQSPAASSMIASYAFKQIMRAVPTMALGAPSAVNASLGINSVSQLNCNFQITASAVGGYVSVPYVADARL